jgi:hypothetical protein
MLDFQYRLRRQIRHIMTVVPAQLDRYILVNRAGVGFLLGNS